MRCKQNPPSRFALQRKERIVRTRWLRRINVYCHSTKPTNLQSFSKRRLVHAASTRRLNQDSARLHHHQLFFANEPSSFWKKRNVQTDHDPRLDKLFQRTCFLSSYFT